MVSKTLSEFYKYTVFLVFAVVLAQSFPQSVAIFTPIDNLRTYQGIENAFISIFVYIFILTSWIGYFLSITKNPHTETKLGTLRFGLDLFTIYQFYYILNLTLVFENHKDIFTWLLPAIFITYSFWDLVKYLEYRHKALKGEKVERINRTIITLLALLAVIIQSLCYNLLIPYLQPLIYSQNNVWNIVFIITSTLIVTLYRWQKRRTFKMKRKYLKRD